MSWLTQLFGVPQTVNKALDIANKFVEDKTAKDALIVELARIQAGIDTQQTVPVFDALYKMGRQLLWWGVIVLYFYAKLHNVQIDIGELALLISGPAAYTLVKGKGFDASRPS